MFRFGTVMLVAKSTVPNAAMVRLPVVVTAPLKVRTLLLLAPSLSRVTFADPTVIPAMVLLLEDAVSMTKLLALLTGPITVPVPLPVQPAFVALESSTIALLGSLMT